MAFGDCLKEKLKDGEFMSCENKKNSPKAFWVVLRDAAKDDLIACSPQKIDSGVAIEIYYKILLENMDYLPYFICAIIPSNKQERFRVVNRNTFSSNAFHSDGLANQDGILAYKNENTNRRGESITFQGVKNI